MSSGKVDLCSCKVGRIIDKYEIPQLREQIVQRREQQDASLRALSEYVNIRILRRAIEDHADREIIADPESLYTRLTEASDKGRTTEIRERLSTAGIPIEDVMDDFVSHQTVRYHLQTCLEMDTGRSPTEDREDVAGLINWAMNREEEIINRAVSRLQESGELEMGEPDVIHSVRIICGNCGESHRIQELLDKSGCQCGGIE